jgi:ubiquinone biosynthesis protein UbiJ
MWSILALGAAERLVNRVIDLDAITRIQLNQLQGQLLRVVIASPQLSVDVFFDENILRLEPTATGHSETPACLNNALSIHSIVQALPMPPYRLPMWLSY